MAWVCVGYSGEELIFSNKPRRENSSIIATLKGRQKTAGGYKWIYAV